MWVRARACARAPVCVCVYVRARASVSLGSALVPLHPHVRMAPTHHQTQRVSLSVPGKRVVLPIEVHLVRWIAVAVRLQGQQRVVSEARRSALGKAATALQKGCGLKHTARCTTGLKCTCSVWQQ